MAGDTSELEHWQHDYLLKAKRITDVGSDDQTIVDEAVAGTTYVGRAGRGVATSNTGWLLTKISVSGTTTTIQHAIAAWDDRAAGGTTYT